MTELNYIASSGTQYIDTGIVPDANTKVEMDFRLTEAGSGNRALFAVDGQFSFRWYGSSSYFRSNGKNNVAFPTGIDSLARHRVVKTATLCTLDDTYSVTNTAGTVTLTLYLFGQHTSSGMSNPSSARVFSCRIYSGDELVRDYVPALDEDGAACLYDRVSESYFYNAGTGEFIAGSVRTAAGRQGRGPRSFRTGGST